MPDNQVQPLSARAQGSYSNQPILNLLTGTHSFLPAETTTNALGYIFLCSVCLVTDSGASLRSPSGCGMALALRNCNKVCFQRHLSSDLLPLLNLKFSINIPYSKTLEAISLSRAPSVAPTLPPQPEMECQVQKCQ